MSRDNKPHEFFVILIILYKTNDKKKKINCRNYPCNINGVSLIPLLINIFLGETPWNLKGIKETFNTSTCEAKITELLPSK